MKIPRIAQNFDYWDLRSSVSSTNQVSADNEAVNALSSNSSKTYGLRVLNNGFWAFVSSGNPDLEILFKKAIKLLSVKGIKLDSVWEKPRKGSYKPSFRIDPFKTGIDEQVSKIKELNARIMTYSEEIKSASTILVYTKKNSEFIDSNGSDVIGETLQTRYFSSAVASSNGGFQQASEHNYLNAGLETFYKDLKMIPENVSERAVRLLHAKPAPPKRLPVVCDSSMTGVFFHEAVGHSCEADLVISNSSVMKGKVGKKIASSIVNFSDYHGFKKSFGRIDYDDEGIKKGETSLISEGVLKGYLHSLHTASIMKTKPTGNGRAMSPSHFPIPRMTTLKLKPGNLSNDELVSSIDYGVLVKGFTGGEVDPITGKFIFAASESFMIENGSVTFPLRDVTISGDIESTLNKISAIGKKPELNNGGVCGKAGQYVPVNEFMPWIKIDEVLVGGRAS